MHRSAALMNSAQPMAKLAVDELQKTSSDILSRILAVQKKAMQRQQGNGSSVQQAMAQLPPWPEVVRGVPNALLRTALFTISKNRQVFKGRELLASTADIELRFKGERFNQTDLGVWEMLLHLSRLQPLGGKVEFSAYSLLKALGRDTGKTQHEQLKDEIARLQGGVVEISWKRERKTFSGQLVGAAYRNEVTQQYVVILNEKLLHLYDDGFTHIDWVQRQALKSNLAKWLHGFYASHALAYPYKVETLRKLCGSDTKQLRNFRKMLKVALDDLFAVNCIKGWQITPSDLVYIVGTRSDSQVKHVNKMRVAANHQHNADSFNTHKRGTIR